MKTIILVRHAKSSWEYDLPDEQRPLKKRGLRDANLVAESFKKLNVRPDKIYSSPAKRALETSKIFLKTLKIDQKKLTIVEDLYDFNGTNVIKFIKNLDNQIDSLMIFGHNHAFTSITNIFGSIFIANLPTSGLVKINFNIDDWKHIDQGKTEQLIIPKKLRE